MDLTKGLMAATIAVPSTILVLSSVASSTACMTDNDHRAVRRSLYVAGGVIAAGAMVTGEVPLILATVIGVLTMLAITYPHLDPEVMGS